MTTSQVLKHLRLLCDNEALDYIENKTEATKENLVALIIAINAVKFTLKGSK